MLSKEGDESKKNHSDDVRKEFRDECGSLGWVNAELARDRRREIRQGVALKVNVQNLLNISGEVKAN
jgi:hypothetical protein